MDHPGFPEQIFIIFLLAVLYQGSASGAAAFDSHLPRESDNVAEIAAQVKYWSGHCGEKEKAKNNSDARQCWWDAAKALGHYTTGDHALVGEVRRLRIGWLWRALQLTIEAADPSSQRSSDAQRGLRRRNGPDLARLAGPVACSSITLSDYNNCLTATPALRAPPKQRAQSRRKVVVTPTIVRSTGKKIAARPHRMKTKPVIASVPRKPRTKKVVKAAAVGKQEAALPVDITYQVVAKVRKRNFARPYGWKSRNARDRHVKRDEL